jgi:glyoxylase-like metal-dependent hydrolase (beta-lactamase superfamily II)
MSSFVLFAGEETILFDAGLGGETWVKKLTDAGVQPESVKLILLTHMHPDHIGGLLKENVTAQQRAESGFRPEHVRRFPNAKILCAKPEYDHWITSQIKITEVGGIQHIDILDSKWSQQIAIRMVYGGLNFTTFNFDDVVFENSKLKIKALDAVGHTPGHTAFLIETQKEKLLIVGDILHAAALQFPAPEVCSRYDMDAEKTVASRKRILDLATQEKIPVAGMHFPAPHVLLVEKNDQGGYTFRAGSVPDGQ